MSGGSRLLRVLDPLPGGALVTVEWVRQQLAADGLDEGGADLTCEQAGELWGRAASTVRTWCASGQVPGAYRLNGREWRVPPGAFREMRAKELERPRAAARKGGRPSKTAVNLTEVSPRGETAAIVGEAVDLGAWRKVKRGAR